MSRSGGRLAVDALLANGADTAFAVPGESYLEVLDALHDERHRIRLVGCRQEGGAAYMAEAYGRLTGRPGVCLVTRGPGATNASVGVHSARQGSVPMVLLVGQIPTGHRALEAFQHIDYRAFYGDVAKWVTEVDHPDDVPAAIAEAFRQACCGRQGPAVVALPEDVLEGVSDVTVGVPEPVAGQEPSAAGIDAVLAELATAERPVVLAGGGSWADSGRADLRRFAEAADVPVVVTFRRNDLMDNHSPCYAGEAGVAMPPAVRRTLHDADLVVAVGSRFGDMATDGFTLFADGDARIVHIHPSAAEFGKIVTPTVTVHADPGAAVAALADRADRVDAGAWAAWRADTRQRFLATLDAPSPPSGVDMPAVMAFLRETLPDDVIVTNGAGNFSVWPNKFLLYGPRARLLAPQNGTMGYGLPAAVAAKVVYPDRTVLCFAGDGDLQMTVQELGSAAQEGARPIVLVVDNGMYGTIRMHQERRHPGRVVGTDIVNPDFVALARAYGFHAERIDDAERFPDAFARAVASPTGALLHLVVDPDMLTPRQSVVDARAGR